MTQLISARVTAVLLLLLPVTEAQSQKISAEPSAVEVAFLLRNYGGPGRAIAILTQVNQRQTQQRMDEIADTITAIAISLPGNDVDATRTRSVAQSTILLAGLGVDAAKGINQPIPYAGATDRLMRMVELAQDVGVRAAALTALLKLPKKESSLEFFRKIATSQNAVAYLAVSLLCNETGAAGIAIGRELFQSGTVIERNALEAINRFADIYKWR